VSITAILLIAICLANLSLGLFVLVRNTQSRIGQSFFAMSILISAWAATNYLTDNVHNLNQNVLFNKLAYLFALLAIAMAAGFSHYFVNPKRRYSINSMIAVCGGVGLLSLLSISHYVAGTVARVDGQLTFSGGPLTSIYTLVIAVFLGIIIWDLYKLIRRGDLVQKNQAKIIITGFGVSIVIGMLTNAIIPALSSDNFETAKYGPPILSLIVVASISYAIIKHQLFDIRPVVARSFAYVMTLTSVAAIYSVVVFGIAHNFFATTADLGQQVFYIVFTIIAALAFQPLSKQFNKISNRIFLHDYYEPQEVLDRLSNLLVGSVEVKQIEKESASVLKKALHPAFLRFLLSSSKDEIDQHLLDGFKKVRSEMLIFDDLSDSVHSGIYEFMRSNNIAAAVRLRTRHEELGFMLMGFKDSGSPYSAGDKKLLAIAADEIAISLQSAVRFEEIRHFNITLQEKVDAATKQLRNANQRLKELDQTKDEFISMASHQLRTPLTTIKGYLSMVLDGDVGPVTKDERKIIQQAFDSSERMVFLIGDLLNISRLQSGKFVIENKPTDLAKMVDDQVDQLKETAANHHLTLDFKKPDKFPALNLDETKIQQVVMNFMDNAIFYTPAGGSIIVALEATDHEIRYTVTDTGLGVPKSEQHHLFAKFYRAGNARKMRPDGTGLGLFMAKKVIAAQGGAIIFKSVEGKGSTFGFSFPRAKVEAAK
jgi:signal transduction histidine kinase